MNLAILVLLSCAVLWSSATRLAHEHHVAFKESPLNGTNAQKRPTLLSTNHNSSALGGKSGRSTAVQELLGILANEMQSKQPLDKFVPVCLAHIKKLVKAMDQAYTDVQLHFMLEHECWLVKTFPHAYSHGFESHRACKCFSEKLSAARMWELSDGSQHRYEEFCTAYFNDPNAEGITECAGEPPPPPTLGSGSDFVEPLKPGSPDQPLGSPEKLGAADELGSPEILERADEGPLGAAKAARGPGEKTLGSSSPSKGVVAGKPGDAAEPTVEPPFMPSATEEDDAEIERQMKEMQKRITKEVADAEAVERDMPAAERKRLEQQRAKEKLKARKMRPGQAVECPYKSGSYEWCDYIIDGEPTLDKENVAWDSKSSATKLERKVERQTEEGDGPEPHAIVPNNEPLPDWARKKIEEARARNKAKEASNQDTQAEYRDIESHWAQMRKRSKKKAEYKKASENRYRTQWERMQKIAEQKRLRDQSEKELAHESKSWPWPKDDPEWDNTDVQQKTRKASRQTSHEQPEPVHSLAACAVSPLALLASIVLIPHP